jgi:hypothetical protein
MPGMLTTDDLRVVEGGTDYVIGHRSGETKRGGGWFDGESTGLLPDFSDPATLGCVLALVREAWGDPCIGIEYDLVCGIWLPVRGVGWNLQVTALAGELTEGAALVAALEAAP